MRALILGVTGFAGSHLAEYLIDQGIEVWGNYRKESRMENIQPITEKIKLVECDLRDPFSVNSMIKRAEPEYIFHLASQSVPRLSIEQPVETIQNNLSSCLNLLEAVRQSKLDPIIQFSGSSDEYGLVLPEENPVKESNPLRPQSPYGFSKVAGEFLFQQYHRTYGIRTIITRMFNHEGPRRGSVFVTSRFSKQIAEIEKGKNSIIQVGDLNSQRDYTDVRDVVAAYLLAVQKCEHGEPYNICSGVPRKISEVLNYLISKSTATNIQREFTPNQFPSSVPILYGDPTKFREKTGWKPCIPLEKTLEDTLDYWRGRV